MPGRQKLSGRKQCAIAAARNACKGSRRFVRSGERCKQNGRKFMCSSERRRQTVKPPIRSIIMEQGGEANAGNLC